jgi:hypothetical protein
MHRAQWIRTVNRLLLSDWRLSVTDAGIDEDQLTRLAE